MDAATSKIVGFGTPEILLIIALIVGAVLAYATGRIASKKGYNYTLFAIIGFFTGIIGLIIAAVIPDKNTQTINDNATTAQALKDYKQLLDNGAITQEEYDTKKKELLG